MNKALLVGLVLLFTASSPAAGPENLLAGTWNGQYFYPGDLNTPVAFQLHIVPSGKEQIAGEADFLGSTSEPNTFGNPSVEALTANVWGGIRQSGKFSFTKQYDGTGGQTHAIYYEGEVSGNLQSATGTWCIEETWCGTFEMHRPLN